MGGRRGSFALMHGLVLVLRWPLAVRPAYIAHNITLNSASLQAGFHPDKHSDAFYTVLTH